jgi:hypothetical protein
MTQEIALLSTPRARTSIRRVSALTDTTMTELTKVG